MKNKLKVNLPKLFTLLTVFGFFFNTAHASHLVLKTEKTIEVKNDEFTELATFDGTNYNRLRIGVLPIGFSNFDMVVRIEAVEKTDSIFLDKILFSKLYSSGSIVIDLATPKLKISADKSGTYKIFIWAIEY